MNLLLIAGIFLLVLGCGGERKTEEEKSGRLSFVKKLNFGSVGTHGSQGWYVSNRYFWINNDYWKPDGINVKEDIGGCSASPGKSVEALSCYSFTGGKETVYVLRMKDNKPEWVTASDTVYGGGDNLGQWTGEGHWLLFRKYLFNAETSEKREIKLLPDDPRDYFRGTSPDLETIIYQETCFGKNRDFPEDDPVNVERDRKCKLYDEHSKNGVYGLWLIDVKTGNVKIIELKKDKYDWLYWKAEQFSTYKEWFDNFQKQLVWEKDKDGKDQLVAPK